MKKVRIGVMGAYRGTSMINYCMQADNAQVVAIGVETLYFCCAVMPFMTTSLYSNVV